MASLSADSCPEETSPTDCGSHATACSNSSTNSCSLLDDNGSPGYSQENGCCNANDNSALSEDDCCASPQWPCQAPSPCDCQKEAICDSCSPPPCHCEAPPPEPRRLFIQPILDRTPPAGQTGERAKRSLCRSKASNDEWPRRQVAACPSYLMATSTYDTATPITFSTLIPTPIPFIDGRNNGRGSAICQLTDTLFELREPGDYWIIVTIYPDILNLATGYFTLQISEGNGSLLQPMARTAFGLGSPVTIQVLYKVERIAPQLLELVGVTALSPTFTFSRGRGASLTIIKVAELADLEAPTERFEETELFFEQKVVEQAKREAFRTRAEQLLKRHCH